MTNHSRRHCESWPASGLTSSEITSGGFLPPVHLPVDALRSSEQARQDYLGEFTAAGMTLTALNCNGNPLHPHPIVGRQHAQDVFDSIEIAAQLGVKRVVTMSVCRGLDQRHFSRRGMYCPGTACFSTSLTTSGRTS